MNTRLARVDRIWWWFLAWFVVGLIIRLIFIAQSPLESEPGYLVNFDPIYYHRQALAITDGHWFIQPDQPGLIPGADHPPLLTILLAAVSFLGFTTWGEHRVFTALVGALLIPACGALAAKALGRRAGYVAAVIAAVNPMLWTNDGQLMPEPLFALGVALALLAAYHYLDAPSGRRLAVVGAMIGLATLARGEGLFLIPFLVAPLALTRRIAWKPRLAHAAVATAVAVAVVLPWSIYNTSRFTEPVTISFSSDTAMAGANCDETYDGAQVGGWVLECLQVDVAPDTDTSVAAKAQRAKALRYIRLHLHEVPRVAAIRAVTLWGLRPETYRQNELVQNRSLGVSGATIVAIAISAALAAVGLARRKAKVVWPLVTMVVMVTAIAMAFYANTRFRVAGDVAVTVLAAGGVAAIIDRFRPPAAAGPDAAEGGTVAPVSPSRSAPSPS